ncbi:MAG: hypothetical protein EOO89_17175 [Pedobacter sp.]|nr:MAG: hypothetical protein EOO89_17175 [Pedobacter sp.]
MRRLKQYITTIFLAAVVGQSLTSFKGFNLTTEDPALFKPLTFYVAELRDLRDLKGPEAMVLTKFIADNLPKNPSLKPVVIDIKELRVTESPGKANLVNGEIKIALTFSLRKEETSQHLLNYTGGVKYTRLATNKVALEQHLRNLDKSAMLYFNKWMNDNIGSSRVIASGVKIHFKQFKEDLEGDTIFYASSRPLTWSDFQSKYKRSNKYAALVMPNIAYDQDEKIKDGIIHVTLTLKTFLAKSDCWLGSSYKDDYMLNHEQRHFDVAKIINEQFRKQLLKANLNPDNYEAVINMQYLDSYRDMNKMQKAYDTETSHGLNRAAQQSWNKRIDKLLSENTIPDA